MTNTENKKGKPDEVWVIYKGTEFELKPGQKVFELNTDNGVVKEHKLIKVKLWPWERKRNLFKCDHKANLQHLPKMNIKDAVLEFKVQNVDLIKKRKKEGDPLNIYAPELFEL